MQGFDTSVAKFAVRSQVYSYESIMKLRLGLFRRVRSIPKGDS
jgi:hypothetical protein